MCRTAPGLFYLTQFSPVPFIWLQMKGFWSLYDCTIAIVYIHTTDSCPFIHCQAFKLMPCLGYCEWHYNTCQSTGIPLIQRLHFLGLYAQCEIAGSYATSAIPFPITVMLIYNPPSSHLFTPPDLPTQILSSAFTPSFSLTQNETVCVCVCEFVSIHMYLARWVYMFQH